MPIAESAPAPEVITEVERLSPREAEGITSIFVREQREPGCFEAVSALELLGIAWNSRRPPIDHIQERDDEANINCQATWTHIFGASSSGNSCVWAECTCPMRL
jgi:hypothetical protein